MKTTNDTIASLAVEALLAEANLSPKPGLVDAQNNGSHTDMDIQLFEKSSRAFHDGFVAYLDVGKNHTGSPKEALDKIRLLGMDIERVMFQTTGGINTHKGANFSFGVVLTAIGMYLSQTNRQLPFDEKDLQEIRTVISSMTKDLVYNDFKDIEKKEQLTYGEQLYVRYGISGIRKEAEDGYPSVFNVALPILLTSRTDCPIDTTYLQVLFTIMTTLDDSNIISRGGIDSLAWVKNIATDFLNAGGVNEQDYLQTLNNIDALFIEKNLSPGGSADLLALSIFLFFLTRNI